MSECHVRALPQLEAQFLEELGFERLTGLGDLHLVPGTVAIRHSPIVANIAVLV
jgi:hypothetical protein